jgi:hypothetical protein
LKLKAALVKILFAELPGHGSHVLILLTVELSVASSNKHMIRALECLNFLIGALVIQKYWTCPSKMHF